jgi:hypothetical protein
MFRGMRTPPTQPQGMPPSQGQPMQGGQLANMGAYVSPMAQQPQGQLMQQGFGQPNQDMISKMNEMKQMYQSQPQASVPYRPTANYEGTGGLFGNMGAYVSPMAQQQGSPMQSQPTPDMLNNIRMKLQGMGRPAPLPQGQPMQSQPTQGGLFGNMGAYISPVAKG